MKTLCAVIALCLPLSVPGQSRRSSVVNHGSGVSIAKPSSPQPAKPAIPTFYGRILSANGMAIYVLTDGGATNHYAITPLSRITKSGTQIASVDAAPGDWVSGTLRGGDVRTVIITPATKSVRPATNSPALPKPDH